MQFGRRNNNLMESTMADPMTSSSGAWSKAEIERLLAAEDFKYQKISLPYGLTTGGQDRSATARAIFPDSLLGKSVLNIADRVYAQEDGRISEVLPPQTATA